ncbi:UPF0149 family protein [Sphingobium sp.]|uniref:UPF0149 family protein n=1 Tax=Sphingobium sp. TaxID=1912891 RepID=UPI0026373297|nr:UPF0149 family protein [Sphingobium sp.]
MTDYLDELDAILLDQFDDGMLLSELDGYLTGLIVSPDIVAPSRWLKPIWGDAPPPFEDAAGLQRFLDLVMQHHNMLLDSLNAQGGYTPILDQDPRSGEILWEMWIDGFATAMKLAPAGWNRIRASADPAVKEALAGLAELAAISNGVFRLGEAEQNRRDRQASDLIPVWVPMLHAWRLANDRSNRTSAIGAKIGRNDPCPCGSGKKYKKCCALA